MLVLTRKKNEQLVINDNVVLRVIDIRPGRVQLGIEAPRQVVIHRKEIHEAMQREEEKAAACRPL